MKKSRKKYQKLEAEKAKPVSGHGPLESPDGENLPAEDVEHAADSRDTEKATIETESQDAEVDKVQVTTSPGPTIQR